MAPTSLLDFTPSGIDMIFAVSQQNLNEGLAEYMNGLSSKVSWVYNIDDEGNLSSPVDPNKPTVSFSGTLTAPVQPATGAPPVWILDLSQAGPANQVTLNLTFQDGATYTNEKGHTYTQPVESGGAQWVIPFQIKLSLTAISNISNMPDWLKKQHDILNGNYGEVFDLSQVLLDLETLAMTVDPKSVQPKGISFYDWTILLEGITTYLKAHHGDIFTIPPSAGYAVTHNGKTPAQSLPTYTPTAVDIVIIPNSSDYGASSTLVFAMMVQGAPLPTAPANAFTDVTLISDAKHTPGIALISSSRFVPFMQTEFASGGIEKAISQYVQSIKSDSAGVTWQVAASAAQATSSTLTPSAGNNQAFLSFTMPVQFSNAANYFVGAGNYSANSTTKSNAVATISESQPEIGYRAIVVSGTLSMSVGYSYTPPGHGSLPPTPTAWDSPTFAWNWSTYYGIQAKNASDAQSGGGVEFVLQDSKSTFPSSPVNMGGGGASWFSVEPTEQEFVTQILAPVIQELPVALKAQFQSLTSLGSFVFPGGGTFTFQGPAVNNATALYTIIQYQNPN